jgi:hypothetical protein
MRASRGMGPVLPSKRPQGVNNAPVNGTPVPGFKKGGSMASKNWIAGAIKKPGALRKELGAKEGKPIPEKKLASAAKKPGKTGQRARFAEMLKGFKKG